MVETADSAMSLNWTEILDTTENLKHQFSHDPHVFLKRVESMFRPCYEQLSEYAEEMSCSKEDSALCSTSIKKLVLQTRAALRFGLCCLSIEEGHSEEIVPAIQSRIVIDYDWCEPLASLLTYQRGDKKCRILAARLLSNLVTSNSQTASVVSSNIRIAPSAESIASSILDTVPHKDDVAPSLNTIDQAPISNWVDMFLSAAKSKNREAVAAVAATIHNCICSLSMNDRRDVPTNREKSALFLNKVSSNGILISTLLRHFVSAEAVARAIKIEKSGSDEQNASWDSATEWIQLLLSRLAKLGMLPEMFSCVDKGASTNFTQSISIRLLPEHNVLLQCMSREADAYVMEHNIDESVPDPFGGEKEARDATHVFLAHLFAKLSHWFRLKRIPLNTTTHEFDDIKENEFDAELLQSGFLTVTKILANTLGVESSHCNTLRLHLGQETTVLQECAKSLGVVLDDLAEKSVGRKARDIQLTEDDQKLLTSLVQFVGNLCYRCKHNQDLLRLTLVPHARQLVPQDETASECEESTIPSKSIGTRNGLQVLLTCTTYATACFTLREWGVIAIRNVLENNSENQAVVQELRAQGPVESADLDEAGVRVQLDSKGKVSLSTISET
jgi:hypothetical protein